MADVKQCAEDAPADHILAARFLQRFVKDGLPWIHIDLSSGTHKGGLAHIPSDITGFGVRLALHLLLDKGILGEAAQVPKPRSVCPYRRGGRADGIAPVSRSSERLDEAKGAIANSANDPRAHSAP